MQNTLAALDDLVWGLPTIALILGTGAILTWRTRGVQFTKLGLSFRKVFAKSEGHGELSNFSALCTALSATIGTGNIVGVATAIAAGGAGALFWMCVAAVLGCATKYAECALAIKYREIKPDGHVLGGPFYVIERGMGKKWKWLAVLFALFGVAAGLLGIGTTTQINGITSATNMFFDPANSHVAFVLAGQSVTWATALSGAAVTACVALVLIGGLSRIAAVANKIVPTMALVYVALGITTLVINADKIPDALALIVKSAFGFEAAAGGALGWTIAQIVESMQKGVARGIFSNEAGLGSAPIAAAAARTSEPVEQGLVQMSGVVIDTLVVCMMTGLAIVVAFCDPGFSHGGLKGVDLTAAAFAHNLGGASAIVSFLLMLSLAFFAFTTILGWDYYSEKCLEYLSNSRMKWVMAYRALFICAVAAGPYFSVVEVFQIADITNGLMAIPNCIALIALSGVVAKETEKYFAKKS